MKNNPATLPNSYTWEEFLGAIQEYRDQSPVINTIVTRFEEHIVTVTTNADAERAICPCCEAELEVSVDKGEISVGLRND